MRYITEGGTSTRRLLLLGLVLTISVSLFACHAREATPTKLGAGKQVIWSEGEQIAVQGESPRLVLHSLDFIDANTGWVLAEDRSSPGQNALILRTLDGGAHWEGVAELDNMTVNRLRFVDQTTGWAIAQAASQSPGVQANAVRILHTEDGGETWEVQWEDKRVELPSGYDLWFQDTTQGYALINGKLLATRDGGKKWSPLSFGAEAFVPQHLSFVNPATGWVIGVTRREDHSKTPGENVENRLAVFRTTDGGKHWRQQFARDYPDGPVGSIDIDFINATTGWFLTGNMATWAGDLYYTSNGGGDWQRINQIKCVRPTPTEVQFITPQVGWIPLDVGAGPIAGGLLFTQDGGKNFAQVEGAGESVREVAFISPQQGWAVGTAPNYGDYLIRTANGGRSWTQVFPRPRPTQDVSFVDNENGFGLGQLADAGALLASADGGDTWQKVYSFSPEYRPSMLSFINRDTGWVLAAAKDSNRTVILKTTNGGHSWTLLQGDIPPIEVFWTAYFRFFDADHGLVIAAVGDKMAFYRTSDGGKTWQASEEERSRGTYLFSFVSPERGWEAYAPPRPSSVNLNRTKDGSTWQNLPQVGSNARPLGLEFISQDQGLMLIEEPAFAADSRVKLLVTTDGGHTWSAHPFPDGFKLDMPPGRVPLQFTDQQHGWMLSRQGLFRTRDGGKTWTEEGGSPGVTNPI